MKQHQFSYILSVVQQDHHNHQQDQHDKFDIATHYQSTMQQNSSTSIEFHDYFEQLFNCNIF